MIIDKVEYKNYQEWHRGRTTTAPLKTIEYNYKGGKFWVMPNPSKRAIDVDISYKGIRYGKTFEIPCDIVWHLVPKGSWFNRDVTWEKEFQWRDTETMKLAEEFARGILEGLDALSEKEHAVMMPAILPFEE